MPPLVRLYYAVWRSLFNNYSNTTIKKTFTILLLFAECPQSYCGMIFVNISIRHYYSQLHQTSTYGTYEKYWSTVIAMFGVSIFRH